MIDKNKTIIENNDIENRELSNVNLANNIHKSEVRNMVKNTEIVKENNSNYSSNIITGKKNHSTNQMSIFDEKNQSYKKQVKKISKGELLEYRLKRLIFSMGYYPKIGVLLKTSQEEISDMITDLDVYGFYVHKNFSSKTIWADCKSGQAKALERISWIIGVKQLAKIDEVIFVKKGVRSNTREFARKSGVQILDLEILDKLEKDFCIDPSDWSGSWNPKTQMNQLVTFQKINIPNGDRFKKIGNFIASGYWTFDEYSKIKKCITALRQLAEIEQFPLAPDQKTSINWAIFELINLFLLATLNISRELYYFADKDKKETIINGLISGEISPKMREGIVEATYKIAHSIILQQIPNYDKKIQIPNIGLNPPKYSEAYIDLVLRITNNPLKYFDILRFLDFVFMEFDLQSKEIDFSILQKIFPNCDDLIISAKTIIHFICNITGLRKELFKILKQNQ